MQPSPPDDRVSALKELSGEADPQRSKAPGIAEAAARIAAKEYLDPAEGTRLAMQGCRRMMFGAALVGGAAVLLRLTGYGVLTYLFVAGFLAKGSFAFGTGLSQWLTHSAGNLSRRSVRPRYLRERDGGSER